MYNPLPDLFIFGTLLATLGLTIWLTTPKKAKPYKRYHMVDQAKRYGK